MPADSNPAADGSDATQAPGGAADRPWTSRTLLGWTRRYFEQRGLDSPRLAAEMLLAYVLGVPRLNLYMDIDRPASEPERARLRELVSRAGRHEPIDYLVGTAPFMALDFRVDAGVLVPRPSTETLVEAALVEAKRRLRAAREQAAARAAVELEGRPEAGETSEPADEAEAPSPPAEPASPLRLRIADVGTGSGVIAITLAAAIREAACVAVDVSPEAIAVAADNARTHGVADRVAFREGDLLEPLGDERFDLLLSNPPYIPDAEWADVSPNVRDYEPTLALRGGPEGLDLIRPLLASAADRLEPGGMLGVELAASHAATVRRLAEADARLERVSVLSDHEGLPRVLIAYRRNEPAAMRGDSSEAAAERRS